MRLWDRSRVCAVSICAVALSLTLPDAAFAHSAHVGPIKIGHLWAKPAPDGKIAVTGPLFNTGSSPDRLIAARSPLAGTVRFEKKADEAEQAIDAITLPPGKPVSLAHWREHIVLENLKEVPKAGAMVPLTLTFEHAGTAETSIAIEAAPSD